MSLPVFDDQLFTKVHRFVLVFLTLLIAILVQCGGSNKMTSKKAKSGSRKSVKVVSAAAEVSNSAKREDSKKSVCKPGEAKREAGDNNTDAKGSTSQKPDADPDKNKEADKGNEGGSPEEDYPKVPEPSPSAKKKRNKALEEDKKAKIHEGFYHSKSDEHDTLEPVKSLKEERTTDDAINQSTKKVKRASSKEIKKTK